MSVELLMNIVWTMIAAFLVYFCGLDLPCETPVSQGPKIQGNILDEKYDGFGPGQLMLLPNWFFY